MNSRIQTKRRRGVILLVALAMLALFAILAATYLTFASNSQQASFATARQQFHAVDHEEVAHSAFMQFLRGTTDPLSAAYRHDLLGDYYGYQLDDPSNPMRVNGVASEAILATAIRPSEIRFQSTPMRTRGVINAGGGIVKVPVRFNDPHPLFPTPTMSARFDSNIGLDSPFGYDDTLAGRTVSFGGGPLAGHTVKIVRWVGYRPQDDGSGNPHPEYHLRYSLFLDLSDPSLPSTVVLDDGTVQDLQTVLFDTEFGASALFYTRGGDNAWGTPANDFARGGDYAEAGWPASDDGQVVLRINPMPLNGQGTGFTTGSFQVVPKAHASQGYDIPVALQPNFRRWLPSGFVFGGNSDEPYDAPDYENFFLSTRIFQEGAPGNRDLAAVLPSFHRPSLINYILNLTGVDASGTVSNTEMFSLVEAIRRATARPLPFDASQAGGGSNPHFTGSNSSFALRTPNLVNTDADKPRLHALVTALTQGPWDVDNDGDGVPDSVWVDLNLPLITAEDGTLLRALVAPQIEDLSDRFNINAHGAFTQLGDDYQRRLTRPLVGTVDDPMPSLIDLPAGRGAGPAEIVPLLVHSNLDVQATNAGTNDKYGTLVGTGFSGRLANVLSNVFSERYSSKQQPELASTNAIAGLRGNVPGSFDADGGDPLLPGVSATHTRATRPGLPMDKHGRGGLAVDQSGNLVAANVGTTIVAGVDEVTNTPYEFDPTNPTAFDSPYSVSELEKVLRSKSWEQHLLPGRLSNILTPLLAADSSVGSLITTTSSSDERPPAFEVPEDRTGAQLGSAVEGLIRRLRDVTGATGDITESDVAMANLLLPPELRLGMKVNVNRPFGNGVDDNGNGVIDEPGEVETSYQSVTNTNPHYRFDQSTTNEDGRRLLAKHLYVLGTLLCTQHSDFQWPTDNTTPLTSDQAEHYRARRLAQWAVNVVDYRDSDGIMTGFEFDLDLSDGWNVDGDPSTDEGDTVRGVVWGCEFPELLFKEGLAIHDLRLRDTDLDPSGKDTTAMVDPDPTLDSIRIPQGSLFLELFSPRARTYANVANHHAVPTELYDFSGAQPVLDLDRLTPASAGTPAMPVWRIAITVPHSAASAGTTPEQIAASPLVLRANSVDTATFQPEAPDIITGLAPELELERFVLFNQFTADTDGDGTDDYQTLEDILSEFEGEQACAPTLSRFNAFFNMIPASSSTNLMAGNYLVVAPRPRTFVGSRLYDPANWHADVPAGLSAQRFVNAASGIVHYGVDDVSTWPAYAQNATVFYAQTPAPENWKSDPDYDETALFGGAGRGVGLNVSEPFTDTNYYAMPRYQTLDGAGTAGVVYDVRDGYRTYESKDDPSLGIGQPRDLPEDLRVAASIANLPRDGDNPGVGDYDNYRTAYLQRLADPTKPYDSETNPYRTIDWLPIDLTVFNGDGSIPRTSPSLVTSRARNGMDASGTQKRILFGHETTAPVAGTPGTGTQVFDVTMSNSLGYLNKEIASTTGASVITSSANPPQTDIYLGYPKEPFALHPWLNRPYESALELMYVPATSQARLLEEFTVETTAVVYDNSVSESFRGPFKHLLNFFGSYGTEGSAPLTDSAHTKGAHLYRVLDFLNTGPAFHSEMNDDAVMLSRLQGTAIDSDPFGPLVNNLNTSTGPIPESLEAFHAWNQLIRFPFNRRPSFAKPGKINLNTVSDYRVWMGLNWGHLTSAERQPGSVANWDAFNQSRRGYDVTTAAPQTLNGGAPPYNYAPNFFSSDFPTQFAGAFTNSLSNDVRPVIGGSDRLRDHWVEGTLLRPGRETTANAALLANSPLMVRGTSASPATDVDRNPVMRYQSLTRLQNLTSNNSNTYIVRLTVGYFTVDPSTLALGKEYGVDTGNVKRYQASYVVDRSIPCGYVTGADTDTEKLILFRKFSEK
ncbi:hypothetical protein [Rosistilla oblonga]|uniref:hypothetical protein n=1 Tax=Rosistilla oblonga TaxID=2527990 RepID=UPI003A978B11